MRRQIPAGKSRLCKASWVSFTMVGSVCADEVQLPQMKEGLWEWHTQQIVDGNVTQASMKICQTHEQEKAMQGPADAGKDACKSVTTRQSPGVYVSQTHCDKGPMQGAVSKVTMTYRGDTGYHSESHITRGTEEKVTIMESKYLGSCPVDMKPGDAVLEDGRRFNLSGN
jgi:hypothetical protein